MKTGARSNHIFFIFLILGMLVMPGRSGMAAPDSLHVEGIRYGFHGGKTRIVIDFNGKPDFRAFLLDGPPRLAVDVPRVGWKTAQGRLANEKLVKGYRSGEMENGTMTRIVFDLHRPAVVDKAFILPASATTKDRLVIDLAASSQNLFAARTSDVYGNGALKGAAVAASPHLSVENARIAADTMLPVRKPVPWEQYTVVIDPGHGGHDPGAVAGHVREKNLTLEISRELKRQLEETGRYKVVLTREKDTFVKLRERVALSREAGADLFISIHADKIGRKNVSGASVYTLSETSSDHETARLAEAENAAVSGVDLSDESQDVADILLDLAMREKMNESNFLARVMVNALNRKSVKLLPNSHRSAGFAVLKAPDVPAVLIETGFLSNPQEAKLLASAAFQRKLSTALVEGVDAYFRKIQALQKAQ